MNSYIKRLRIGRFKSFLMITPLVVLFQNCGGGGFEISEQLSQNQMGVSAPLDSQIPNTVILIPQAGTYVNFPLTVSGTCEDGLRVIYSIDQGSAYQATACQNGVFSILLNTSLSEGDHGVEVFQTDASGNKSLSKVSFKVDTTAPTIGISAPVANAAFIASTGITIRGSCELGQMVEISGNAIASPTTVLCAGSVYTKSATLTSSTGLRQIEVSQTDLAGNRALQRLDIRINSPTATTPVVNISAPIANARINSRSVSVQGTCVTGLSVAISGSISPATAQATCTNSTFSASLQLSAGDGSKSINVSQTNAQGETGADSTSVILDMTAPSVTIMSPVAGFKSEATISLGGNCETGLTVRVSGTGVDQASSLACNQGMFQGVVNFSTGTGVKAISVAQTDASGNTASDQSSFERIAIVQLNGYTLYANQCASCHLAIASTTKPNRSAAQITTAIRNISIMQSIALSSAEINAIATALANPTGGGNPTPNPTPTPTAIPTMPLAGVRVPVNANNLNTNGAFQVVPIRRLTRDELKNSLADVLKVVPHSAQLLTLPEDLSEEKTNPFDNGTEFQSISSSVVESYNRFAKNYAEQFVANKKNINSLAGCAPANASDTTCFRRFASNVAPLLLRRRIASADLTRFEVFMPYATAAGDFYQAPKLLVQALVQHPEFLYRIEGGTIVSGSTLRTLTNYEIATRISYLVWGSAPDATLLAEADAGTLTTPTVRASQVERMLLDFRATRQWRRYHAQWLGFDGLPLPSNLMTDMTAETNALIDQIALGTTGNWMDIFKYDQTYVTPSLSSHYGLGALTKASWMPRPGGILTHGTMLAQGAKFGDTSPTLRGYRIAKRILCIELGPIPPNVDPSMAPGSSGDCKVNRYSMRHQTSCQSCHALTDNIGFGLENYGATGVFRTTDANLPACRISGEGAVGSDLFNGAGALGDNLAGNPVAIQCAARQLVRFTLGRSTNSSDQLTVEALHAAYLQRPTLKSMIISIVSSPGFGHK